MILLLFLIPNLFSCSVEDENLDILSNDSQATIISKLSFSELTENEIDFIKNKTYIFHSKSINREDFNKFKKDFELNFNNPITLSYENFQNGYNKLIEDQKKGKISYQINERFISKEAISLIEKVKAILNNSIDEKSLEGSFNKSEKLISQNDNIDNNEKNYLLIKLKFIKKLALEENKNARIKGTQSTKPKCKWYQWGCVFYMTTTMVHVLFSYWAINDLMGSTLSILVAEHGLGYIAQCCGWCGCECPAGCPSLV